MEERELISNLQKGDETAFSCLVAAYRNRVYSTALNILQNREEAEDAAQECFIQVYNGIHHFKGDSKLSTWIYRIAVHKSLEKLRKNKLNRKLLDWLPWWMPDEKKKSNAGFMNPGISFENKEKAQHLFKAIESLPEKQKMAFVLVRMEGFRHEEVSEIMQLSIKAVESLLSRAKENLKRKLETIYHQ